MAKRIIHESYNSLNALQIEKLLSILSKLDSILALTQGNLTNQSRSVIHDGLWVASDLVRAAQELCNSQQLH